MPSKNPAGSAHIVGKAEYAVEEGKVRVKNLGPRPLAIIVSEGDRFATRMVAANLFTVSGIGLDEAQFFTALDPDAPVPVYRAGSVAFRRFVPKAMACEEEAAARKEAIKFILRIPEEERVAAYERMVAIGQGGKQ